jgi:hypothetical protein
MPCHHKSIALCCCKSILSASGAHRTELYAACVTLPQGPRPYGNDPSREKIQRQMPIDYFTDHGPENRGRSKLFLICSFDESLHFDTPESQRSARIVPLAEEACSTLGKLRSSSTRPDDLVFSTDSGQPLERHNLLRRQLRSTCEKLGLLGITWHSLRHSHATLLDAAGAPLGTVQSLLAHSTSELTREVYLHAIPEDQRRTVASVEALLFGPKRTQIASPSQTSA